MGTVVACGRDWMVLWLFNKKIMNWILSNIHLEMGVKNKITSFQQWKHGVLAIGPPRNFYYIDFLFHTLSLHKTFRLCPHIQSCKELDMTWQLTNEQPHPKFLSESRYHNVNNLLLGNINFDFWTIDTYFTMFH